MNKRSELYYRLNIEISSLDNENLAILLAKTQTMDGWGTNQVVDAFDTKFFVKRIPLTELEYHHLFSTRNHYDLPLHYNYPMISAGFGAFRELNLHIKTTNWVLSGEIDNFPLMYHYRIIKSDDRIVEVDEQEHNDYIASWNGSRSIDKYIKDRESAPYEIVIFLEYIPYVFDEWFTDNTEKVYDLSEKMFRIFDFLQVKGIIHFDTHFNNILTDGEELYLTDFGLALDKAFCHSEEENLFFNDHVLFDYGLFIRCMTTHLDVLYRNLPETQKKTLNDTLGINDETYFSERLAILFEYVDTLDKMYFKLDECYTSFLNVNMEIIREFNNFFCEMGRNNKKDTVYSCEALSRKLKKRGIITLGLPI